MFCVLNPVIDRLLEAEYFLIKLQQLHVLDDMFKFLENSLWVRLKPLATGKNERETSS